MEVLCTYPFDPNSCIQTQTSTEETFTSDQEIFDRFATLMHVHSWLYLHIQIFAMIFQELKGECHG